MQQPSAASASSARPSRFSESARDMAALFVLGAAFRILLLVLFPAPFGEDGFGRIYFKDRILLSHWLPLAQLLVYLTSRVFEGVLAIRLLFALCGAAASCGFYLFLRRLVKRKAALAGGLLFSFNSLFVILSLMPYQDVLFLGLYYAALAFLFPASGGVRQTVVLKSWKGSLLYGLASLTRYESWFGLPILTLWKACNESRGRPWSGWLAAGARAAAFFGWAPLAWFFISAVYWRGWNAFLFQTADGSFYGWHPHFDLAWAGGYLLRWAGWILLFGTPLTLFSIWGAARLASGRAKAGAALKFLLVNGLLATLFFFFIIGQRQETVFRFVMFALSIMLVLAALGMETLLERGAGKTWAAAGWAVAVAALMTYSGVRVARLANLPEHQDPYRIARFLEARVRAGQKVLVVAPRSPDLQDDAPLLYQRIVAQARLDRQDLLAAGNLAIEQPEELLEFGRRQRIRYLVVFEDFRPWLAADVFFSQKAAAGPDWIESVFRAEKAVVYQITEWPVR